MSRRRIWQAVAAAAGIGLLAWAVAAGLERLFNPPVSEPPPVAAAPETPAPHITATLFYASEDGQALVAVRRDVPLAEGVVAQGRAILTAQLEAPPSPHRSPFPRGTALRAFYVTELGDGFVDVSAELTRGHPGGSLTELLTVYALVNAVTTNLPAIQRVQLLVEGKEVETIAGHVDVRRPLTRDMSLVRDGDRPAPAEPPVDEQQTSNKKP